MRPYALIIAPLLSLECPQLQPRYLHNTTTLQKAAFYRQVSHNPTPAYIESPALCFLILLPSMSRIPAFLVDILEKVATSIPQCDRVGVVIRNLTL